MVKKENFEPLMDIGWLEHLWPALSSSKMKSNYALIGNEKKKGYHIFPKYTDTFNAFKYTPWNKVRVVILGQDPYHTTGMAHGLAFSTQSDSTPPSLRNILKEVEDDVYDGFNLQRSVTNDLTSWAEQGVLLLNTALTVKLGWPGSHLHHWEDFTAHTLKELSRWKSGVVYLLWGAKAQGFKKYINTKQNHVLETTHPSPFSAHKGFLGCKHFSKTNEILRNMNGKEEEIVW